MSSYAACHIYDFVIEGVCMGILCLFGFCGNSLSMACLMKDKSKTATPFLLVSLEVADTLFLVTVLILRVLSSLQLFTNWLPALEAAMPTIGKYTYPCALMAATGTVYLTILVTVNRYISVCRPYEASNLCSIRHAQKHIILVALFSIIYNVPRFFEYEVKDVNDTRRANQTVKALMSTDLENNYLYQIIYKNLLYFLVMFLVPLGSLIILNYKLIKALRKTKRKRASMRGNLKEPNSRSEDDITLVLIVVVLVFVVCQTPALVTQVLVCVLDIPKRRCPNEFFYYERFSDLMVVANSSLNFLIYCFFSKKFRQILFQLVCKQPVGMAENNRSIRNGKSTSPVTKTTETQLMVPLTGKTYTSSVV